MDGCGCHHADARGMGSGGVDVATVEIIYNADEPEELHESASATFVSAADAARWLVEHLRDWCVDESVRVLVDGEEV